MLCGKGFQRRGLFRTILLERIRGHRQQKQIRYLVGGDSSDQITTRNIWIYCMQQGIAQVAKEMKQNKMPMEVIVEVTHLTKEEIDNL